MSGSPKDFVGRVEAVQAATDPTARALIDAMKGQLLIVLIERLGGEIRVPVTEVDATGNRLLSMRVDGRDFVFVVERKQ
jgi:hypothetical protein